MGYELQSVANQQLNQELIINESEPGEVQHFVRGTFVPTTLEIANFEMINIADTPQIHTPNFIFPRTQKTITVIKVKQIPTTCNMFKSVWKSSISFKLATHRWHSLRYFSPSKTRSEIQSKSSWEPIESQCLWWQQHKSESAIGRLFHTGRVVIGCQRTKASLPPWQHCFLIAQGRWKGGKEGRRLSLRQNLCIIHPLSLCACRVCLNALTDMCVSMLVLVAVIGWDIQGVNKVKPVQ